MDVGGRFWVIPTEASNRDPVGSTPMGVQSSQEGRQKRDREQVYHEEWGPGRKLRQPGQGRVHYWPASDEKKEQKPEDGDIVCHEEGRRNPNDSPLTLFCERKEGIEGQR